METFCFKFVSKVFIVYLCRMNDELTHILKKVRTLYRKFGIRSVTMDDVSHELGISKKTLYQYVRDKDELVQKVIDLEIAEHQAKMPVSCTDDKNAIEQLLEIARCLSYMLREYSPASEYDLKKYYPDQFLRVRELRRNHALGFLRGNLEKGIREGLYRAEVNPDIISRLGVSLIDNMVDGEVISLNEFLDPRFFGEFFEYHIRGIANAEGLTCLESQLKSQSFAQALEAKKEII